MSDITPPTPPPSDATAAAATSTAPAPSGNAATSIGLEPNIAAGIASIFLLVGGLVFFFVEKKNTFVRFWSAQLIVAWGAMMVIMFSLLIIGTILGMISNILALLFLFVWLVYGLAHAALFFGTIFMTFTGKNYRIPYVANFADKLLLKFPNEA